MGRWIKYFANGAREFGTDQDIEKRVASWSRGNLKDIISTELLHSGSLLRISGPGTYWQSDTYEAISTSYKSTLVARRIERQILPTDAFFRVIETNNSISVYFNHNLDQSGKFIPVKPEWHCKWLILEYNVRKQQVTYYLSDGRV